MDRLFCWLNWPESGLDFDLIIVMPFREGTGENDFCMLLYCFGCFWDRSDVTDFKVVPC